jgi:hypothetical protein
METEGWEGPAVVIPPMRSDSVGFFIRFSSSCPCAVPMCRDASGNRNQAMFESGSSYSSLKR